MSERREGATMRQLQASSRRAGKRPTSRCQVEPTLPVVLLEPQKVAEPLEDDRRLCLLQALHVLSHRVRVEADEVLVLACGCSMQRVGTNSSSDGRCWAPSVSPAMRSTGAVIFRISSW